MRDFSTAPHSESELEAIISTKDICTALLEGGSDNSSSLQNDKKERLTIEELTYSSQLNNGDCLLSKQDGFTPLQSAIRYGDGELASQIKLDLIYFFGKEKSNEIIRSQIIELYKISLSKYVEFSVLSEETGNDVVALGEMHDQAQRDYAAYYQNHSPESYEYFINEIMDADLRVFLDQYDGRHEDDYKSLEKRILAIYHSKKNFFIDFRDRAPAAVMSLKAYYGDNQLFRFIETFNNVAVFEIIANPYHYSGLLERIKEIEEAVGDVQDEQVKIDYATKIILLKSWLLNWVKEYGLYSNRLDSHNFERPSFNPDYRVNLNKESLDLFLTPVIQADRSSEYVISSQPIGEQSELVASENNSAALYMLRLVCLKSALALKLEPVETDDHIENKSGAKSLPYKMPCEVWMSILEFCFGFSQDKDNRLAEFGALTLLQNMHARRLISPTTAYFLVDAAMRGEEGVVLDTLDRAPYLLNMTATVKNSFGVECVVTVLQAAAMCNDVQLIIKMKERYFDFVPDGLAMMRSQLMVLYRASLEKYRDMQSQLASHIESIPVENWDEHFFQALLQAKEKVGAYNSALNTNNICVVFDAHDRAQRDYVFRYDFYINSILTERNQSQLDLVLRQIDAKTEEEVIAAELGGQGDINALTTTLNLYFRRNFILHIEDEVIANPYHTNAILSRILQVLDEHAQSGSISNFDDKYTILMHVLFGWASRNMSECERQEWRYGPYSLASCYDDPSSVSEDGGRVIYERMFHPRPSFFVDSGDRDGMHPFDISITDPRGLTGWGYQLFPDQVGDVKSHSLRVMRDSSSSLSDDKRRTMRQLLSELPLPKNKPQPIQSTKQIGVGMFSPQDEKRRTVAKQLSSAASDLKSNKPRPAQSTPTLSLTM